MKRCITFIGLVLCLYGVQVTAQPLWQYPVTVKDTVADQYFDTTIYDAYRWLENDSLPLTRQWIAQQNAATQSYLAAIPFREKIRAYLTRKWNYARETPPVKMGDYYVFSRNNGLQNQSVWYIKKGIAGKEEVLLDPNTFSADGTMAVTILGASANKKYIAYAVAEGGSDWNTIYILDIATKKRLPDVLPWVKFPRAAWKGNGFYYSRYPAPEKGRELFARNTGNAIYYHQLGNSQQADSLVFTDGINSKVSVGASVTEDERFLIISAIKGSFLGYKLNSSTGNALYCQDLSQPGSRIDTLVNDYISHNIIVANVAGSLLLQTDRDAPANKVVLVNPRQPQQRYWTIVVPEQKESLVNIETGCGFMWLQYLQDASSVIHQYTYSGHKAGEVVLPAIGTASGFAAGKNDTTLFYTFTNCVTPPAVYQYSITTAQSAVYSQPQLAIDASAYEVKRVFCTSKDGTRLPVFIVHKKGMVLDGSHPAFILGHGGFKRNLTPFFHVAIMLFIENGGVYAQPALRGGNEYGERWHQGGMRQNKQHVFDDCIAATEYLVREGYTQPGHIAISGQSTGAVMVAACSNQRPDLYKVALPAVGMQDMLRYHKFTIGASWAEEYGTSDDKDQFHYLVQYSPLHNIRPGSHPATFITTADHDDTVVPGHSYKYAAALQASQQGANPVLIRIDSRSGHGPGKPVHKQIEEATDVWSFVFQNLGMDFH